MKRELQVDVGDAPRRDLLFDFGRSQRPDLVIGDHTSHFRVSAVRGCIAELNRGFDINRAIRPVGLLDIDAARRIVERGNRQRVEDQEMHRTVQPAENREIA